MKKIIGVLLLVITLSITTKVSAHVDDLSEILRQIAPDEENATFYGVDPEFDYLNDYYLTGIAYTMITDDDYDVFISEAGNGKYNVDISSVERDANEEPLQSENYEINITFVNPTEEQTSLMQPYFNRLNTLDFMDFNTYYKIEDLSLINYFLTSDKSELWNPGAPARAFRFSDINDKLDNANLTYRLVLGMGVDRTNAMFEAAAGELTLIGNGTAYGVKSEGIYLKMVLYIPESTEDTPNAYIAAAKARIDEYLGDNDIEITYGGVIADQNELEEDPTINPSDTDGNFYNVTVGTVTYKFYIMKGTEEQLEFPTYKRVDINSNVEVESDDSSIPLDTTLTVKSVENSTIENKLGTDEYKAYDFKLYSDGTSSSITQLENGKFQVKIPIPEGYNQETIKVYYIPTTGDPEEYEVTPTDGYAVFETSHFSVYALTSTGNVTTNTNTTTTENPTTTENTTTTETEKEETNNPKTGDMITNSIAILSVSVAGIIISTKRIKEMD